MHHILTRIALISFTVTAALLPKRYCQSDKDLTVVNASWSWPRLIAAPFRAFPRARLTARRSLPDRSLPDRSPVSLTDLTFPHLAHLSYWFKLRHPRLVPSFRRTYRPIFLHCFLISQLRQSADQLLRASRRGAMLDAMFRVCVRCLASNITLRSSN